MDVTTQHHQGCALPDQINDGICVVLQLDTSDCSDNTLNKGVFLSLLVVVMVMVEMVGYHG